MVKLVRVPAFVDLHVHFREPGFTEKEDLISGARAAAAGGFTTVCMMPNTRPAIDSVETLLAIDRRGRPAGGVAPSVRLFAASAMTLAQAGETLCDFTAMDGADTACRALTNHGVCGLSEDGRTLQGAEKMERVCDFAKRLGLPVMDHAEPEAEIVERDIALARRTGARFHIQHVSLAESVALIRAAKADGLPISCETAPHYFALTEAATRRPPETDALLLARDFVLDAGAPITEIAPITDAAPRFTNAKMNPPLRSKRDRAAIIEGLCDGTIDCIATDHAPHEAVAKSLPFADAPNGIIGLETAFAVSYTVLVKGGFLSLDALVRLMSENPARLIGFSVPSGDSVLLDVETPYEIDANSFCSKGRNTPFHGMRVYGRVKETVLGGRVVYTDDGALFAPLDC